MKFCTGCQQHLTAEEFGGNRTKPDGLQTKCKSCMKQVRSRLDFRDLMESEENRQVYSNRIKLFQQRFGKGRDTK